MTELKPYLTLCRINISLFAALSAATGFFLAPGNHPAGVFVPAISVFLLACGASALNQYQERAIDARMARTRNRPLPSGLMTPIQGLAVSFTLLAVGLLLLANAGAQALMLGLGSLLWYNGVYTRLKRMTAFAAVPGAAVGMGPPAIGWISAGGGLLDPRLAAICLVFFMWQVPHFWLLLLLRGEEYEKAGLPSLFALMSSAQLARVTYIWIFASAVSSLMLPLYGVITAPALYFALVPPAVWLVWSGRALARLKPAIAPSPLLFRKINIYLFLVMSLLALEHIVSELP